MIDAHLGGSRIGDPLSINPIFGLAIMRIVDLLWWIDGWFEVGEQAAGRGLAVIDGDGVGVVRANYRRQDAD